MMKRFINLASLASLLVCPVVTAADWINTGTTDWNTGSNWTGGAVPSGVNAVIQSNTGSIATISANISATPVDIQIGIFGGTGRLDHTAGIAQTGAGNWMFIGWLGTGVYNLANTAGTGGTLTGFGQGSGTMNVNGNLQIGDPFGTGGGNGTININTSGALNVANDMFIGRGAGTGVVNLDSGTLSAAYLKMGYDTGNGTLNQSGGTVNSTGIAIMADVGSSTVGAYNKTGGTFTAGTELWVAANGTGTFTQSAGSSTINSWTVLNRFGSANGTVNISGGSFAAAATSGNLVFISEGGATATAAMNVSGGTVTSGNNIWMTEAYSGNGGSSTLTVSGSGSVTATNDLQMAMNTNSAATVNLNGGTLQAKYFVGGNGTSTLNFNGGTLKAAINNANLLDNIDTVRVRNGGAVFDTNGFDVTVTPILAHSNIGGDSAIDGGLTKNGLGQLTVTNPASTFTGAVTVNAGTLYANAGNAATDRAFSYASSVTVNSGATLRVDSNSMFGWDGSQAKPVTVNAGGTAISENGDTVVANVTLAGGTLSSVNAGGWGSWSFGRATNKTLAVTQNSTVSASNVAMYNGSNVDVSAGRNLSFTGTLEDSFNGPSALIKNGGSGTMTVNNAQNYTGGSTISAGVLNVTNATGSATGTGSVTVANGASVAGTGRVAPAANNFIYMNGALTVGDSTAGSPVASLLTLNTSGSGSTIMGVSSSIYLDVFLRGGDLTANAAATDRVKLFGTMDLTAGGSLILGNPNALTGFADGDWWTLFDLSGGGTITDDFSLDYSSLALSPGLTGSFNRTSGVFSIISAVPEPSRALLLLIGLFGLVLRRRR